MSSSLYVYNDYAITLTNNNDSLYMRVVNKINYNSYELVIDRLILNTIRFVTTLEALYDILNSGFSKDNDVKIELLLNRNSLIINVHVITKFMKFDFDLSLQEQSEAKNKDLIKINKLEDQVKDLVSKNEQLMDLIDELRSQTEVVMGTGFNQHSHYANILINISLQSLKLIVYNSANPIQNPCENTFYIRFIHYNKLLYFKKLENLHIDYSNIDITNEVIKKYLETINKMSSLKSITFSNSVNIINFDLIMNKKFDKVTLENCNSVTVEIEHIKSLISHNPKIIIEFIKCPNINASVMKYDNVVVK